MKMRRISKCRVGMDKNLELTKVDFEKVKIVNERHHRKN